MSHLDAVAIMGHQGGWDEALLVAAPLVVIGGLLWAANKRAARALSEKEDHDAP